MLDHQVGKLLSINENYFASNLMNITSCIFSKSRRCDEYSLICLLQLQCSGELHNIRPTNRIIFPSLCLNIKNIQSEFIFLYYSIDTAITTFPNSFACINARTTVPHCYEQFHYRSLEKSW